MDTKKKVQVNYLSKDFASIRNDLEIYLKAYYPEVWKDFNVTSPGMALVDIAAYVGDLLSFVADKKYNENYLEGVSERKSVYRLAKTLGLKPPGFRPAITLVDISIEVPTTADGPDPNYLPLFRPGAKVKGGGQTFETEFEIDFSSDFSSEGVANRLIEPLFNANQDLIRYRITKREKIKAGTTKIFSQEISESDSKPFYSLVLPEKNILDIVSVIVIGQLGITETPTYQQFNDPSLKYYEVEYLAQNKIFIEDPNSSPNNGVSAGIFLEVEKRFTKDYLSDGSCKLQFGNGTPDYNAYENYLREASFITNNKTIDTSKLLDNTALGVKIPSNSTLFVKYKVGGGLLSNVGTGVLTEVGDIDAIILGTNPSINQQVISSTRANNPIAAVGGASLPSVNEIKFQAASNFATQNRAVTLKDYIAKSYQIPSKFGAPFRIQGIVQDNKVILYIIARDGNGNLVVSTDTVLKNNLILYMSQFRMINDFIEINDGKIINLQIEVDLYIDKTFNINEIKLNSISQIRDFFDVESWEMNENIYISQIVDILREIPGVINVSDIRFYNMEGGNYSSTRTTQANQIRESLVGGGFRTQITPINNTIFGTSLSMFEIKYPNMDIRIRTN